ncbi:hypothetical protein PVAP13_8KG361702 [Panicum virgatum]|uniref:PGG domain-containing protein n=1 Tax=Panicum virgatum TaxID=38727 RepID=A0A8T0PTW8_PANVG|nr:hypothetical protein PVAP13_8KG361702 [Panicum virgatum]
MAAGGEGVENSMEYLLKKYLLLLATLVATVTYAAGLNPPGGSWPEDSPPSPGGRRIAGDSILRQTNYQRYIVFYFFNAFSFAASLVVSLLLLVLRKGIPRYLLHLMQTVMVVDLLGLVGAYAAGSGHDRFTRRILTAARRRASARSCGRRASARSCWCSPSSRRPSRTRPG